MLNAIKDYQCGCKDAFTKVYLEMKDYIEYQARTVYIHGYEREDLEQEFLIELHKAILGFNVESGYQFSTYFSNCVKNRISSISAYVNTDKHKSNVECSCFEEIGDLSEDDIEYVECEVFAVLAESLSLTEDEKELIKLRMQGYKNAEISRILGKWVGIGASWADKTLRRIRKKMLSANVMEVDLLSIL